MESRCDACSQVSISKLVEPVAARLEEDSCRRLLEVGYHAHLSGLEAAAATGCDLCKLILDALKTTKTADAHRHVRVGRYFPELFASTRRGPSATLYEDAKKAFGDPPVRLHITAHHLDEWDQGVENSPVLDAIIVQVGMAAYKATSSDLELDRGASDTSYAVWGLPPLVLTISVPRGKRVSIGNYNIGRFQPDDNLGSIGNLTDARAWFETCQKEHPKPCPGSELSELPTRVINVGTNAEGDGPRIEYSQSQKGFYVALSHCWGGKIATLLTTETEAAFLKALPVDSLSANFRDAITITRALGIKYLWIDSLCILQDSKEDWEKESRKMAAVYRDASLVLFAIAAASSTVGLLKPVPSSTAPLLPLRVFSADDGDKDDEVMLSVYDKPAETLSRLYNRGPLWDRAWTLQEGILSPRDLYFGNEGVYWKCHAANEATTGVAYGNNVPTSAFEELDIMIQDSAPNRRGAVRDREKYRWTAPTDANGRPSARVMNEYYRLVRSYSWREITYGSDIFPAFSSLASTLHPSFGGEYVAGGWSGDLRRSLLWHGSAGAGFCIHATTDIGDGPGQWRAPSWSWASAADAVSFGPIMFLSTSAWDGLYEGAAGGAEVGSEIKSYKIELVDPQNPFGAIRSASLVIEARTIPVVRCDDILSYSKRSHEDGRVAWDEPVTANFLDRRVDNVAAAFVQTAKDGSRYMLVAHTRRGDSYMRWDSDRSHNVRVWKRRKETYKAIIVGGKYGLIIAPVAGHAEGAWERKGYFELINLNPEWDGDDDEEAKGKENLTRRFLRVLGSPFRFLRAWVTARKKSDTPDFEDEDEEEEVEEEGEGERGEEREEEGGQEEGEEGEEAVDEVRREEPEDNWRNSGWPFETFLLV